MSEVERESQKIRNLLSEDESHQGTQEISMHPIALLLWIFAWINLLAGIFLTVLAPDDRWISLVRDVVAMPPGSLRYGVFAQQSL